MNLGCAWALMTRLRMAPSTRSKVECQPLAGRLQENYTPDRFKWANAVLLSRAFATKISGQNCFAFAPLADFFNHKPDIKTTIRWKNDHLEFIAGEAYATAAMPWPTVGHGLALQCRVVG